MTHLAPGTRPQTLRQAKRAYAKSSARPAKLSASEIAMAERRAVLQERADRIKEREARRKANLRKKEERREVEREKLMRGGKELEMRGFRVGGSQLDLGRFLPGVGRGGKGEGEGEDGARSRHSPCDNRRSDGDLDGLEDREDDQLRSQRDLGKKGVSFDMFDDGDEQEDRKKPESERQPESDGGENQARDIQKLSCEAGAGTVNRLDLDDPKRALDETQRQWEMGRGRDEIPQKTSTSSISLLREQGRNTAKRLKLETGSLKTQSFSAYGSVEQVKQTGLRHTHIPDKKQPTSTPSRKSPLREICTNSVQRPSSEKPEPYKGMPPPPPRLFPTMVAITSFEDDLFPSNTQVEREISPDSSTKHQNITMKAPNPQAKIPPIPQPRPEYSHDFLDSISTQDLDFSGLFTQVAPSKTSIAPPADPITPPQPQRTLPKHDSITNSFNPQQVKNEFSLHHIHRPKPPLNNNLPTENDLLANISTQDLFSSQSTIPNSPPPSPPPKSLPTSSTTHDPPSSQFPTHIPPPPPRPKISSAVAACTSTSFDLDDEDDGFTADDLATIAVQVELAMSGSSAGTAASAKGDEG